MGKTFEETLELIKEYIIADKGIIDLSWCEEFLYPFYKHFNDPTYEYRTGSLIAFWGMLMEWEDGSGLPFCTNKDDSYCHQFDKYIKEFIKYSSNIKQRFPNIYSVIVNSLMFLDKNGCLEEEFQDYDKDFFNEIRTKLFDYSLSIKKDDVYKQAYKEAGILFS